MIHYIHVDSAKRDSTFLYGNSYTITLTSPIRNVEYIELVSALVPNTMYTFTSGMFTYNSTAYTIPQGFYTPQQLANTLHTMTNLTVIFLQEELRFIFASHASFTLSVTGDFIELLGNPAGSAQSTTGTPYQYDLYYTRSQIPVPQRLYEYVFLDIQEFRNTRFLDTQSPLTGATVAHSFAALPMNVLPGEYKNFNEKTDYLIGSHVNIPRLDRLTVRWVDTDGQLLSFNGVETHAFILRIHSTSSAPSLVRSG